MIDDEKVRRFWDARAARLGEITFESVGNLEQDAANLELKMSGEIAKIFGWLPSLTGSSILDLGAGVGQWSFRFASRGAQRVLAVERSSAMASIGREEAERRGHRQVAFQTSAAEEFHTNETFDLVFVSGLFLYLNSGAFERLLPNLHQFTRVGGLLMVRESIAIGDHYEIHDRFSQHLGTEYSAIYRTRGEYVDAIRQHGLELIRDENMFPEGHPLNKYPETRLHLFLFGRAI